MQKLSKRRMLNYLIEYIILTLNELCEQTRLSDFGEGTLLAYVECLEILSQWKGFRKFGIIDIESHFGIKP